MFTTSRTGGALARVLCVRVSVVVETSGPGTRARPADTAEASTGIDEGGYGKGRHVEARMGIVAAVGILSKIAVNLSLKRLVWAAGNMNKSNHPLMRLVKGRGKATAPPDATAPARRAA